jgi:hypothetical protein
MPRLSDTSPEVERLMAECYRRMPVWRKLALLDDANRTTRVLHDAGFRSRHPGATPEQVRADWLRMTLGGPLAERILEIIPMSQMPTESVRVAREVMGALQSLGVECVLGGSFASTVHGYPRSTQDADVMAEPFPGREADLTLALGSDFYVSTDAARDANARRSSFNVIHTTSGFKVDVFIEKARPFDRSVLIRRTPHSFSPDPADTLDVVTPEDVILLKLEWYRIGGEISDRQWNDILGVMRTQAGRLDDAYLDHWAADIGVKDLLDRIRTEV